MTDFVLDNSVTMRWLLESGRHSEQAYADAVLKSLVDAEALVPNLWHLEAANVLLGAEQRGELDTVDVERFIARLEHLPIRVDPLTAHQGFNRTLGLSRAHRLSSYDAAYLELAIREELALATLDKDLVKAAKKAGVAVYLG